MNIVCQNLNLAVSESCRHVTHHRAISLIRSPQALTIRGQLSNRIAHCLATDLWKTCLIVAQPTWTMASSTGCDAAVSDPTLINHTRGFYVIVTARGFTNLAWQTGVIRREVF